MYKSKSAPQHGNVLLDLIMGSLEEKTEEAAPTPTRRAMRSITSTPTSSRRATVNPQWRDDYQPHRALFPAAQRDPRPSAEPPSALAREEGAGQQLFVTSLLGHQGMRAKWQGLDKAVLDALPVTYYHCGGQTGIRNFCMVCLEEFRKGDRVRWLPCVHHFHSNCIRKWFNSSARCPVCKSHVQIPVYLTSPTVSARKTKLESGPGQQPVV